MERKYSRPLAMSASFCKDASCVVPVPSNVRSVPRSQDAFTKSVHKPRAACGTELAEVFALEMKEANQVFRRIADCDDYPVVANHEILRAIFVKRVDEANSLS